MSLYNMVRGFNPLAPFCMSILRTPPKTVPRFRDAWLTDDGRRIVIMTRTGGNNRMDYVQENAKLRQLAGYYTDTDDGDDNTYAKFYYNIPVLFHEHTATLATLMREMGMGEYDQGPGGIMRALDKSIQKQTKPPLAQRAKFEVALKELAALLEEW
jgi:hypothetical protein